MNWINAGPLRLRAVQSGIVALIDRAQEITGLLTFNRGTSAPFAVDNSSAAVVTNLDADKLDGNHASAFASLNAANTFTANQKIEATRAELVLDYGTRLAHFASYVDGSAYLASNLSYNGSSWNLDDTGQAGAVLALADGSSGVYLQLRYATAGANPRTLSELLRVTTNGDWGIGTASPSALFHLYKTGGATLIVDTDTNNDPRLSFRENNSEVGYLTYDTSGNDLVLSNNSTSTGALLILRTSNTNRLVIDKDGLTAVGNNLSPTAWLHLPASTTAAASLRIPTGTAPTSPNDGDMWYASNLLRFRDNSVSKTVAMLENANTFTAANYFPEVRAGKVSQTYYASWVGTSGSSGVITDGVFYIELGDYTFLGTIDVTLTGGYNTGRVFGRVKKTASFYHLSGGASLDSLATAVNEASGQAGIRAAIGDPEISGTSVRIPIYKINDSDNIAVTVLVTAHAFNSAHVTSFLDNISLGSWATVTNSQTRQYPYSNERAGFGVTSVTARAHIAGSTTGAASLRIESGTAPTTPNSGDMWYDGTNLKFQDGATTRTITWT